MAIPLTHVQLVEQVAPPPWSGPYGSAFIGIVVGLANDMLSEGAAAGISAQWLVPYRPGGVNDRPEGGLDFIGQASGLPRYAAETTDQYLDRLLSRWTLWTQGPKLTLVSELTSAGFVVGGGFGVGAGDWTFDGVDDQVLIGDVAALSPTATTPFSVSGWYTGTDLNGPIFSKMQMDPFARGWTLHVTSGKLYGGLFNTDGGSDIGLQGLGNSTINDGVRKHCVLTYDGSTNISGFKLYVNNVLQTLSAQVNTLDAADDTQTTWPAYIGTRHPTEHLAGVIEHVAFWDKELTSGDRTEIFNGGTPPDLSGVAAAADLVAWYPIDGTDSTAAGGVLDSSGNGFNGTAEGGLGDALGAGDGPGIEVPNDFTPRPDPVDYWSRFWIRFPVGSHPVTGPAGFVVGTGVVGTDRIGPEGFDSASGALTFGLIRSIVRRMKPSQWVVWDYIFELEGGDEIRLQGKRRFQDADYVYSTV